jgi:diacylglycerol kinase (ATP)
MRFILVVNPQSGKKQSAEILQRIQPMFESQGHDVSVIETAYAGHAREIAAQLKLADYDGFLALGGDGTFHEVVNGIMGREDAIKLPIGLIPGGSGNSFLHDLDLVDPIDAAKAIIKGHTRPVDVVRTEMNDLVLHSMNLIGWGLVTDVGRRAEGMRWLGPSRYTIASIIEIFLKKSRRAKLVVDGETFLCGFTFIIACNSLHVGKGMKMAPNAKLDDGLIDIVVVDGGITRRRLLSVLPKLFDGTHIHEPEVTYYQASSFALFPETDEILNIDGEMVGTTPITVTVLKHALAVFA